MVAGGTTRQRIAAAAALLAITATIAGCALGPGPASVEGPVTVYASLPLTGPEGTDGRDAASGARLALERVGGTAGDLAVRLKVMNDAGRAATDLARVGQNARRAASDSSTAAYVGELDSGPTRTSLPILNVAGIAQVSPGATAVDLTTETPEYPGSPDTYLPSSVRTFARVIPDDAVVARAAARAAAAIGATSVVVPPAADDPYRRLVARELEQEAATVGLALVEPRKGGSVSTRAIAPGAALVEPFTAAGPPMLGSLLVKRVRASGRGPRAVVVAPALAPSSLPGTGRQFLARFRRRFGREPGPYAAYGYEAMAVVIQAIDDRDTSAADFRSAVAGALLHVERQDSVLGPYSFTTEGETTLCKVQLYRISGSHETPGKPICAPE